MRRNIDTKIYGERRRDINNPDKNEVRGQRGETRNRSRRQSKRMSQDSIGKCICPECGNIIDHKTGVPCRESKCPECGHYFVREVLFKDKV